MSEKSVFRHWLHREYWDVMAKSPGLGRQQVIGFLIMKYPNLIHSIPKNDCFACQAQLELTDKKCRTKLCPLSWKTKSYTPAKRHGCLWSGGKKKLGLLATWEELNAAGCTHKAALVAEEIRDSSSREPP